jgi:hypothetical protein
MLKKYHIECKFCDATIAYRVSSGDTYSQYQCVGCNCFYREYVGPKLSHPVYVYEKRKEAKICKMEDD